MQAKITFRNTSKSLDGSKVELFYVLYLDRSHQVHLTEKSNYYSSKRASMESKEKHFPHSFVKIFFHPTTTTMLLVTSWVEMVVVVMLVGPYQIVACLLPFGSISQLLLPLPLLLLLRLIVHHESHKMSLSNPPPGRVALIVSGSKATSLFLIAPIIASYLSEKKESCL